MESQASPPRWLSYAPSAGWQSAAPLSLRLVMRPGRCCIAFRREAGDMA